jgi:AUX/IAA family
MLAQRDPLVSGIVKNGREEKQDMNGLLDGSGEYTLVYEDEEGDRVLAGDVPWKYVTCLAYLLPFYILLICGHFCCHLGIINSSMLHLSHSPISDCLLVTNGMDIFF